MVRIKPWVWIVLLLFPSWTFAQDGHYMVFFTDKAGSNFSTERPTEFLSERAIERRKKQSIAITEEDLPVNQTYVSSLKEVVPILHYTSKWFNAALVEVAENKLSDLLALPFVDSVLYVAPPRNLANARAANKKTFDPIGGLIQALSTQNAATQLEFHGVPEQHENGFSGQGIIIGVFDDGFNNYLGNQGLGHLLSESRIVDTYDFTNHSSNVNSTRFDHGSRVLSTLAAKPRASAIITGSAPDASFLLYMTEDSRWEFWVEQFNWIFGAERADSIGVDIISTSLGYGQGMGDPRMNYRPEQMDGRTTVIARGAEKAFSKGIFLVSSAGNYGNTSSWQIIASPADAKNVLAVGATNASRNVAPWSSRGPAADGRVKPDVMGLGLGTSLLRSNGTLTTANGTSFSAPIVAGFVANLWQEFPFLTNKQLLEMVRQSADRFDSPDEDFGFGFPHYTRFRELLVTAVRPKEKGTLAAYPNPFDATIFIESSGQLQKGSPVKISILDTKGIFWLQSSGKTDELGALSLELDLGNLPKGLYVVKLDDGRNPRFAKIIKR